MPRTATSRARKGPSENSLRAQAIVTEIARMTDREREALAARMPTVCNPDGHALTIRNTMMLVMQSGREDLTIVAGFKQWIDHGRMVRKGERSVGLIAVPIRVKERDRKGNIKVNDETGEESKALRFRFFPVFDISQTEALAEEEGFSGVHNGTHSDSDVAGGL